VFITLDPALREGREGEVDIIQGFRIQGYM